MSYRTGLAMWRCRLLRFLATLTQRGVWRHTLRCIRTADLFCMTLRYHWLLWLSYVTASSSRGNPSFTLRCHPCYGSMHSSPRHRILLTRFLSSERSYFTPAVLFGTAGGHRAQLFNRTITARSCHNFVLHLLFFFEQRSRVVQLSLLKT